VTIVVGTLVPFATPLIGMLMLGNLMRESGRRAADQGVVERARQRRDAVPRPGHRLDHGRREFLNPQTLMILVLGLIAFALDTVMGVCSAS
jgi:Na+-transporting methylmalonyl-CoA/oxaloacetate decarboxylase beta subunit